MDSGTDENLGVAVVGLLLAFVTALVTAIAHEAVGRVFRKIFDN